MVLQTETEHPATLSSTSSNPATFPANEPERFVPHTRDSIPSQQHDYYAFLPDPDLPSTALAHSPRSNSTADTAGALSVHDAELLFPGFRTHVHDLSW